MDRPNISSDIDEKQGNTASPVSTPGLNSSGEQGINKPAGSKSRWRSFSRDPFSPHVSEGLSNEPQNPVDQKSEGPEDARRPELKHPGSKWIHLFYDLAWTASFASLAQSGTFIEPMVAIKPPRFISSTQNMMGRKSYHIYRSLPRYCGSGPLSIYFYTNDWFHFISIFLQLFIFGMLAATTNGYDITAYISHSPGLDDLVPEPELSQLPEEVQLEHYSAERTDLLSARTMALAFAITRFLHLVQYLRACVYARWGKVQPHESWAHYVHNIIHPEMYAIVIGLIFSNMIFFAVVGIVFSDVGTTVLGASLKVGLWVGGFLLEVVSHMWYPVMQKLKGLDGKKGNIQLPKPQSLSEYFDTITTIILGEGINGFAGTLASILTAPSVGRAIAVNVISTAFIIWFIAYIYFEGPHSGSGSKDSTPSGEGLRRMVWMVIYLPLLASIFLLLVGIKNQFLLTAFISTVLSSASELGGILSRAQFPLNITDPVRWQKNTTLKNFMFARGIIWSEEYDKLMEAYRNSTNSTEWKTFHGDDGIPENVQTLVDDYYNADSAILYRDRQVKDPQSSMYSKILTELMDGGLGNARYILVFAAVILLSLGLQSLVHSKIKENDRYQLTVIICRLIMGTVLSLLLLLNLGKYKYFFARTSELSRRIGVFQWLEAFWVLPTIAIAYGIQFLIEVSLTRFMDPTKGNKQETQTRNKSEHGSEDDSEKGKGKTSDVEAVMPTAILSHSYSSEPDKGASYFDESA
ncbi:Bacterial low temperature requirement A protein (LtrA), partial [Rhizoctonia solani]